MHSLRPQQQAPKFVANEVQKATHGEARRGELLTLSCQM